MIYVQLASRTNSTIFTNCCQVAILPIQPHCPGCGKEVYPGVDATDRQRDMNRWNWAYGRQAKGEKT